jgi:hypothetical protein
MRRRLLGPPHSMSLLREVRQLTFTSLYLGQSFAATSSSTRTKSKPRSTARAMVRLRHLWLARRASSSALLPTIRVRMEACSSASMACGICSGLSRLREECQHSYAALYVGEEEWGAVFLRVSQLHLRETLARLLTWCSVPKLTEVVASRPSWLRLYYSWDIRLRSELRNFGGHMAEAKRS